MPAPNRISSGPALGSVDIPVMIPPMALPVNQNKAATPMPIPMKTSGRRVTNGPRPIKRNRVANSTAAGVPAPLKAWPSEFNRCPYQPGSPSAMPVRESDSHPDERFWGRNWSTAKKAQMAAHIQRPPHAPRGPWPAADEARPVRGSLSGWSAASPSAFGLRPHQDADHRVEEDS